MVRVLANVYGREVISSNFVIAEPNEIFDLFPFDDDEDFKLSILVKITDELPHNTKRTAGGDGRSLITHRRSWSDGRATGNVGRSSSFASDADYKYFISFAVTPVGNESKSAVLFSYSISREPV